MSKNDITGDNIKSKLSNKNFEKGYDSIVWTRICCKCGKELDKNQTSTYDGETYCTMCLEDEWES